MSLRLKQAELLLREERVPVADIAFTSGFNSIEHFSAAFRKRYGVSPAHFRGHEAGFRS
jgi:AraC-like DNA-binding protein